MRSGISRPTVGRPTDKGAARRYEAKSKRRTAERLWHGGNCGIEQTNYRRRDRRIHGNGHALTRGS
ncbi:uncharacterized protein BO97DRAFT_225932 [Aspergillus homomorphus CBS 101889]|uniref:Uncharacterized protein n=1 Tax=Aspergillus homomorphus (strain CBS 101889) TaxID=1450537 RepID=A0A395HPJ8_ASPHC|nr:hypothetical protein BO97DRAFT_225932 [Aspergillus homomorphus CBS 101889]RAL08184.1 hypothetical protein BO97DRAFT_225932 [Aspergillus homomorphus CBS 101889]